MNIGICLNQFYTTIAQHDAKWHIVSDQEMFIEWKNKLSWGHRGSQLVNQLRPQCCFSPVVLNLGRAWENPEDF